LQTVPLVQMAMHPPWLRSMAAAPMAAAVMVAAPATTLGLPELQAASKATRKKRLMPSF
jgi:hypothetical protein